MTQRPPLGTVREDLQPLADHDVVLYGSYLTDRFTPRSDVDAAVVTRQADPEANRRTWRDLVGTVPDRYDVRVFELLPLDIRHDIAEHHEVLFGDPVDLSYYFYRTRRAWKDVRPRIEANRFTSLDEKLTALDAATRPEGTR